MYRRSHHIPLLLTFALLCIGGPVVEAQEPEPEKQDTNVYAYPVLSAEGIDVAAFIPPRWHLLDSTRGDLNNDGYPDLVLVVERDSAVSEQRRTLDGTFAILGRPRILAICLRDPATDTYRKAVQTHRFVLRSSEGGVLGDPWDGMAIRDGILHVNFAGGSAMQWALAYKFAWKEKDCHLVGVSSVEINTTNGDSVTDEYDLTTWSVISWTANINPDGCRPCKDCENCAAHADCPDCHSKVSSEPKMATRKLKKDKPRLLSTFEPNLWEIEPGKRI